MSTQRPVPENATAVLERVVALGLRSPKCLGPLCALAADAAGYSDTMREIESFLRTQQEGEGDGDGAPPPGGEHGAHFCDAVVAEDAQDAVELLLKPPSLAAADPLLVSALARLSSLRPDATTMLDSNDPIFRRVLAARSRDEAVTGQRLMQEDFGKLNVLYVRWTWAYDALHEAAGTIAYTGRVLALEKALEDASAGTLGDEKLAPIAERARKEESELRDLILSPPRFSAMLRDELLEFEQIPDGSVPVAQEVLGPELMKALGEWERARRVGVAAAGHVKEAAKERIECMFECRIWAADHLLKLRRFAKLDTLAYRWPELADYFRLDRTGLIALERQVLLGQEEPLPPGLQRRWDHYKHDDQLRRFLLLRPLFRDVPGAELDEFFEVAQSLGPSPAGQSVGPPGGSAPAPVAPSAGGAPITSPPQGFAGAAPGPAAVAPPSPAPATTEPAAHAELENLVLRLRVHTTDAPAPGPAGDLMVNVGLDYGNTGTADPPFTVALDRIVQAARELHGGLRDLPLVSQTGSRSPASRGIRDLPAHLRRVGSLLFESFVRGMARKEFFERTRNRAARFRLLLDIPDDELSTLPWECLFIPGENQFAALTRRYSLVRLLEVEDPPIRPALLPPLRVLAVFAKTVQVGPLDLDEEERTLAHALEEAERNRYVTLQILRGAQATADAIQAAFQSFQPHIFHFVGHGTYDEDREEGAIIVPGSEGDRLVHASRLVPLFADSQTALAVLNGCETGRGSDADPMGGVAGALVSAGVPAVIATMRPVADAAAILFTREFYRSFARGYSLEGAVVEARKALNLEGWDWSEYALFTNSADMESLRLPGLPALA